MACYYGALGMVHLPARTTLNPGGENRSLHQGERTAVCVAPVFPRFICRSFADTKHALIVGAPDDAARTDDGDNPFTLKK